MTTDNETVVQAEEPASEEQVSQEPEALTKEQVAQMIAEATTKAVQDAKEAGRRELQSQQDRNRAELQKAERRAKASEDALSAMDKTLSQLDPETAKELELARLRAEREGRTNLESEEELRQRQESYIKDLKESMGTHLESLGIAKDDSRVDWASDESDYLKGRARFDDSVAKILKENRETEQSGFEKRLKELEAKLNITDTEANSVETTSSTGAVASSDAEFVKKFAANEVPFTKENVDRYNKILNES